MRALGLPRPLRPGVPLGAALLVVCWLAVEARAADPAPDEAVAKPAAGAAGAAEAAEPGAGVDLDRLLKLPSSNDFGVEKRGGATRGEWRSRFRTARTDVDKSKKKLAGLQGKLDEAAAESDSPWRFVPPGASTTAESTENYSLTEAIRREKSELKRAETRLRELEVEANLANVPDAWRE